MIRIAQFLAALLIAKAVVLTWYSYRDYFPPNFRVDFLIGRSSYFFGAYQWAFYVHVVSGPITLLGGLLLLSESFRRSYPAWHRRLGRVQVACVLLLVAPSGLWMARYAATGTFAAVGFAALAVLTAICAAAGWRAAVARKFKVHRHWMLRCYVLLCSAVVLRVIGGASEMLGVDWTYPLAAWLSWLLPLAALEIVQLKAKSPRLQQS